MPHAYYNEFDPYAAAWLRNLIDAGVIAPGVVDERDIRDIDPFELGEFTQCHFFAGIGVWSYALRNAGWSDDRPVWTGSCPCQPFSAAGRGVGFADERHLWPAFHHLIEVCKPPVVFGEQVASKDGLAWLDVVHADMEAAGYAFGAFDLCAAGVGAPHIRQRLFYMAHAESVGLQRRPDNGDSGRREQALGSRGPPSVWWDTQPFPKPVVDGSAFRLGSDGPFAGKSRAKMLRGYGNAIVAPLAEEFIKTAMEYLP